MKVEIMTEKVNAGVLLKLKGRNDNEEGPEDVS